MSRRVVIINDEAVAKGGATGLAVKAAIGLSRRGRDVSFIARKPQSEPRDLQDAGVTLDLIEGVRVGTGGAGGLVSGLWNAEAARRVAETVAQEPSDTVFHVHNWTHFLSPAILAALKPVWPRTVLHAHDMFLFCPNGAYFNYRTDRDCTLTGGGAACAAVNCDKRNRAHKLWRVARHWTRQAALDLARFGGRIALIHPGQRPYFEAHGVPGEVLVDLRNPVAACEAPRVEAERNAMVLFLGRMTSAKGPDRLLEAARRAGAPAELAGDGELRTALEAAYPEAAFHGHVSAEAVQALLRRARVVAMPSRAPEPFGLVACEALAAGVPVIASSNALVAGEIEAGGAGLALDMDDIDGFAAELRALTGDDQRVRAMSEAARATAFSIASREEAWLDGLEALYAERLR